MNKLLNNKNLPFWLMTVGLFLGLTGACFLTEGMFVDGMYYAAISHNLAHGLGTFWCPQLSETLLRQFHEHPPLAFAVQSIFYHLFGESLYIEKIYSMLTMMVVGYLIVSVWKTTGKNKYQAWIPLLLWIIHPLVFWAATNNILENTMSIFVTLSVLFYFKSGCKNRYLFLFLSGLMLLLGFFTKGFTALFPFSLPFFYWLFVRNKGFGKMLIELSVMLAGFVLSITLLFWISNAAYENTLLYINHQVVDSIKNVVTTHSRFDILGRLLLESIPHAAILLLLLVLNGKNKVFIHSCKKNYPFLCTFFCLGLSGVLPIMISMKQSGFYMIAALPFFALAWAFLINDMMGRLIERISRKLHMVLGITSTLILIAGIVFTVLHAGAVSRDNDLLEDMYRILPMLPQQSIVSIDPSIQTDWALHGYFSRYKNISLDAYSERKFLILSDTAFIASFDKNYNYINTGNKTLYLYENPTK